MVMLNDILLFQCKRGLFLPLIKRQIYRLLVAKKDKMKRDVYY